ncbi:MAG: hypothetical protein K2W82_08385 [Candidatus Obscuribacterales bacterium]|nr:hypothetical protein [Candidatus Obscuribacterales bacterium]
MISRRFFLISSLSLISAFDLLPAQAAKKVKPKVEVSRGGPRTIARQEWPPAITPEYAGIVDRGYACFADDMGRLAVVDLKREDNPQVIGELFGIGRKVVALSILQYRAFAVVQTEVGADTQYQLVAINLAPADDITVMSRIPLADFSEPSSITAFGDNLVVGGLGLNGESQIVVYSIGKKKSVDPLRQSALVLERTPIKLDLQEKQLSVLCGAANTDLVLISLANARVPEKQGVLPLDGSFHCLARNRSAFVVAGTGLDRKPQIKLISTKSPLKVLKTTILPAVTDVLDLSAQREQFLILANQGSRQAVVPFSITKKNDLMLAAPVLLPAGNHGVAQQARIAVKDREAYIASDWGGVQVLGIQQNGWQFNYSHTIPRLPASGLAVDGNKALLAGSDLKLYNLADLHHPLLESSAEINANIRAMQLIGGSVLCLTRDRLLLRAIRRPAEIISSMSINGTGLAYDQVTGRAYVLNGKENKTMISELKVTEESLQLIVSQEVPFSARRIAADDGRLVLAGLSEIALYQQDKPLRQISSRQMPNLAVRDLLIKNGVIYLCCVDENLKGYFMALAADKEGLPTLSSLDLPVDAATLAVSNNLAVVLGRAKDGKDKAVIISWQDIMQAKIVDSFAVIDSASAVTIRDKTAIIAGRGLEIINLN